MNQSTDQQLLRGYAERRSEPAFTELVQRHIDLVYSAALRMVRDAHLAKDVTQAVFVALANNARQLRGCSALEGWLHGTTRNIAANAIRAEVRRRNHEQEAAMMNQRLSAGAGVSWEHVAPHLDDALGELSEPERDALLLRYFKNQDFRTMGATLGISDDAAQKRASRAVERLREIFAKRGVTVGASGLVVVISANAVQGAPAGLAISISAAALTGTAGATSTAITTLTKTIAMTMLQKTLITATVVVLAGAAFYEARQAARLRDQVQTVQQQQAPLEAQIQQLQSERDELTKRLGALADENTTLRSNTAELLKLRNQATALMRDQGKPANTEPPAQSNANAKDDQAKMESLGRQLGEDIVGGIDPDARGEAFKKLVKLAKDEYASFQKNGPSMNDNERADFERQTLAPIHAAFDVFAKAAVETLNPMALNTLSEFTQNRELHDLAIESLGWLAGEGNKNALQLLLNPEVYGIFPPSVESSTLIALSPAARNGNEKAVEGLAALTKDSSRQDLWRIVAVQLSKPAQSGNPVAIEAMTALSASTNPEVRNTALSNLKAAAANQNRQAIEALRSLGIQ